MTPPRTGNPTSSRRRADPAGRFIAVYSLLLGLALLAPFNFVFFGHPFRWDEEGGIAFQGAAAALSERSPGKLADGLRGAPGLSLEVWLKTGRTDQLGPARIVSHSHGKRLRNFTLAQEGKSLVFRLRTTRTDLNGLRPQTEVDGVFEDGSIKHLVITYDYRSVAVFVDGELRTRKTHPGGTFDSWDRDYPLAMANEPTADRQWHGTLHHVAIYRHPLSDLEIADRYSAGSSSGERASERGTLPLVLYTFEEGEGDRIHDLGSEPPLHLRLTGGTDFIVRPFFAFRTPGLVDGVANLFLFMPIGIAFGLIRNRGLGRRFSLLASTIACSLVMSTAAEYLQYYLLSRHSSLTDTALNVLGAILGWLFTTESMRPRTGT